MAMIQTDKTKKRGRYKKLTFLDSLMLVNYTMPKYIDECATIK